MNPEHGSWNRSVTPEPRSSLSVTALAVALVLASVVGTGLPGLGASSPVDLDDQIEELDEDLCPRHTLTFPVSDACADWVNTCCLSGGGPDPEPYKWALAIAPDGDTLFLVADPDDWYDPAQVAAIDAHTGQTLWRMVPPSGPTSPSALSIAVSPDGSTVFYTGWGIRTVALNATTGEHLWTHTHDRPDSGDSAADIAVAPDGETVYITGTAGRSDTERVVAIAIDAQTGSETWVATSDSRFNGEAVGVTPDGSRLVVTGYDLTGPRAWPVFAYNTTTGQELWMRHFDGNGTLVDHTGVPRDLGFSPDGSRVYMTGSAEGPDTVVRYATATYRVATGELAWFDLHGDATSLWRQGARALASGPLGDYVYVTGATSTTSIGRIETVAYHANTGEPAWVSVYDYDETPFSPDRGNDIVVSPDGSRVYITGESWVQNDGYLVTGRTVADFATVAYDADNGSEQWVARYDREGNLDFGAAAEIAPDGSRVFVLGPSASRLGMEARTVAYNASGPNPVIGPLIDGG